MSALQKKRKIETIQFVKDADYPQLLLTWTARRTASPSFRVTIDGAIVNVIVGLPCSIAIELVLPWSSIVANQMRVGVAVGKAAGIARPENGCDAFVRRSVGQDNVFCDVIVQTLIRGGHENVKVSFWFGIVGIGDGSVFVAARGLESSSMLFKTLWTFPLVGVAVRKCCDDAGWISYL